MPLLRGYRPQGMRRPATTCAASTLLMFAVWLAGAAPRADEVPRRVLMLHAYNYTFPASSIIADAARKRFGERSPKKIEVDADFLDLVRVSDPGHAPRMAAFLRDKYARTPPDVIMA